MSGETWERLLSRQCAVCGHRADAHEIEPPYYCPAGNGTFTELERLPERPYYQPTPKRYAENAALGHYPDDES